jgi:hydrogenase nickel incorporation protein HypB
MLMDDIRLIEIKEEILSDNRTIAEGLRRDLRAKGTLMINIMSSPGAGKTSLILKTAENLKKSVSIAVIEADIDSMVDSEKIAACGVKAVQIRTGGGCHLDASMVKKGLEVLELEKYDLVVLENVGNLVCPAEVDTGAERNIMILSIPEGDDKPLKYPLMFTICHALVINKIDYSALSDFDTEKLRKRVLKLNPNIIIFEVSCSTGQGIDAWISWLKKELPDFTGGVY